MEITKFSASAMEVAELCVSRWDANNKAKRTGEQSSIPAKVGSACHGAMEAYVRKAIMSSEEPRELRTLELAYMQSYMDVFDNADFGSDTYKDGWKLLVKWHARTSWDGFTVLMVEKKLSFPVPTGRTKPDGSPEYIPFNYIFDRFDQLSDPHEFRVMDYKTLSQPLSPLDLHNKTQARVYGLAAQILHPEATKVWVGFDMLRWESPIETVFSREDNIETWRRVKAAVRKIIDTDPKDIPETLNSLCGWCIKKTTCKAVQNNIDAGGVWSLDLKGQVDARALLKMQAKAATDAVKELDKILLSGMQEMDVTSIETDLITAQAVVRGQRSINPDHVLAIAGEELFQKYGERKITMSNLDDLLSDPLLDGEARARLESSIVRDYGEPYISTRERKRK